MEWDFQIVQVTAAGTFGTVCIAFDWIRKRFFALKVLKERFCSDANILARTRDEATLLSTLSHPHILHVEALIEVEGRPVVVMDWIQGCSLQDLIRCTPQGLDPILALEMIRQAALALDAAYSHPPRPGVKPLQVVHRDIKPPNILLSLQGQIKVVDFGIARASFAGRASETVSVVLGSREYMAPERLDGALDSPKLDVYALGLVLYELIAGELLKLSLRPTVHPLQVLRGLERLDLSGISEENQAFLRFLIQETLEYEPEDRPSSAELAHQIQRLLNAEGRPPDLPQFASEEVRPIFDTNSLVDPRTHWAYKKVSFLNKLGPTGPNGDPDIDTKLRHFLQTPGWATQLEHLWTLLLLNPSWTTAPFLEWLEARESSWWQFWSQNQASVPQKIALLRIFGCRFDDEVRVSVTRFLRDPSVAVQKLARALLVAEESTGF